MVNASPYLPGRSGSSEPVRENPSKNQTRLHCVNPEKPFSAKRKIQLFTRIFLCDDVGSEDGDDEQLITVCELSPLPKPSEPSPKKHTPSVIGNNLFDFAVAAAVEGFARQVDIARFVRKFSSKFHMALFSGKRTLRRNRQYRTPPNVMLHTKYIRRNALYERECVCRGRMRISFRQSGPTHATCGRREMYNQNKTARN